MCLCACVPVCACVCLCVCVAAAVVGVQAGGKPVFARMYPLFVFVEWTDGVRVRLSNDVLPLGSARGTLPAVPPHVAFDGTADAAGFAQELGWPVADRYRLVGVGCVYACMGA